MKPLDRLRERWGGGLRPEVSIDRASTIERWDGNGEGRSTAVHFEGFGFTAMLFIGRTPPRDQRETADG